MSSANIEMLERAAVALGDLIDDEVVFVGGATVGLWATDEATAEFRPTNDVDVIVEAQGLILDAMPPDASILGFENRWEGAFPRAATVALPSGQTIRAVPPPTSWRRSSRRLAPAARAICSGAAISRT
jgi:hypothetical protein